MLAAPQCSCNCPLQHRAAAKQLCQEGFLRTGLPLLGIVSNSKTVPLPQWKYCPTESSWNSLCQATWLWGREGDVSWALLFLLQGSLRFVVCTGYLWRAFRVSCYHKPLSSSGRCFGFMSVCRAFQRVSPFYQRRKVGGISPRWAGASTEEEKSLLNFTSAEVWSAFGWQLGKKWERCAFFACFCSQERSWKI